MSVWGELASTCAKANGVKATVIYGSVRDLDALYYTDYPIFACDYAPNAGSALGLGEINVDISVGDMTIQPGDFFYGDETGVVIIHPRTCRTTAKPRHYHKCLRPRNRQYEHDHDASLVRPAYRYLVPPLYQNTGPRRGDRHPSGSFG